MATEDLGPADLGIDPGRSPQQLFRWLVASILLGGNVRQTIAKQGYEALVAAGYTSPAEFERTGTPRWCGCSTRRTTPATTT